MLGSFSGKNAINRSSRNRVPLSREVVALDSDVAQDEVSQICGAGEREVGMLPDYRMRPIATDDVFALQGYPALTCSVCRI